MDISLSSTYIPNKHFSSTATEELKPIRDAGFTHIQWAYDWDLDYFYTDDELRSAALVLKDLGLKCKDIHAAHGYRVYKIPGTCWHEAMPGDTNVASFDESLRKKGSDLVRNRLKLAEALGAESIVLHFPPAFQHFGESGYQERFYEQAYKTLDENEDFARDIGVRICIENIHSIPRIYLADQFDRFFSRYDSEYIGLCCDTGHLYVPYPEEPLPDDPFAVIRKYTDRLYAIHLNDNYGLPRPGEVCTHHPDAHAVLGDGIVDFDAFAGILAASPYTLPVVGEFVPHGESEKEFLTHCHEALAGFTKKVQYLREQKTSTRK